MNTSAISWAFSAAQAVFSVRISLLGLPTVYGQLYCFLPINTLMKMLPAFLFRFEQCCVSVRAVEERMLEIFAVK